MAHALTSSGDFKSTLMSINRFTKNLVVAGWITSLLATSLVGCDTYKRQNKATKGAIIGVGAGAAAGTVIGKSLGNTALGAILGAALGGTAGVLVGKRMDRQAEELKNTVPNATVQRVGEGIDVKFDSGILFDVDKTTIKEVAKENLTNFAKSLQNNPDTKVEINGYTDNTGSPEYNLNLSERRADAVKSYLTNLSVEPSRLTTVGYGVTHPVAKNSTERGRAQNRRVEILITANDKMKEEAKRQATSK